jgi:hypothetical protein
MNTCHAVAAVHARALRLPEPGDPADPRAITDPCVLRRRQAGHSDAVAEIRHELWRTGLQEYVVVEPVDLGAERSVLGSERRDECVEGAAARLEVAQPVEARQQRA